MSRLDSNGGFGGPRIVKPQANVYTVLLLVACLLMGAALAVQVYRYLKLQGQSTAPGTPAAMVAPDAPAAAGHIIRA